MSGKLSKLLAITLVLWCAGAGCLLISCLREGSADQASVLESSEAIDDMMSSPSCHARPPSNHKPKSSKPATKPATAHVVREFNVPTPAKSGAMSCCPLVNGTSATASRVQVKGEHESAPAANPARHFESSLASYELPATPLRLPNQNHIYLRSCSLLI